MKHRLAHKAFTLIEILIAIVLIGAIGITTFSMFYRIASMKEVLSQRTMVRADLDAMTREIERALMTCFAAGKGFEFKGTAQRIDIPCRIERLDALMAMVSEVDSAASTSSTSSPTSPSSPPSPPSPPSPTEGLFSMWFDSSSQQILASTSGPSQQASQGDTLVRSVAAIRFRYRVGDIWESSFSPSQQQGLPQAVEVSVWLVNQDAPTQDQGGMDGTARSGKEDEEMFDEMDLEGQMPSSPADVSFVVTVPDAQVEERVEDQAGSGGA